MVRIYNKVIRAWPRFPGVRKLAEFYHKEKAVCYNSGSGWGTAQTGKEKRERNKKRKMNLTEMIKEYANGSLHKFMFGGEEKTVKVTGSALQGAVSRGEKETTFVVSFVDIRTGEGYTRRFTVR